MARLSKVISTRNGLRFIVDHPLQVIILLFLVTLLFASQLPKLHFRTSIYDMAIEDLTENLR
ncbi:MAG: hypothetical protein AMK69_17395, partial [Nitrospira bacterium SG8_3]